MYIYIHRNEGTAFIQHPPPFSRFQRAPTHTKVCRPPSQTCTFQPVHIKKFFVLELHFNHFRFFNSSPPYPLSPSRNGLMKNSCLMTGCLHESTSFDPTKVYGHKPLAGCQRLPATLAQRRLSQTWAGVLPAACLLWPLFLTWALFCRVCYDAGNDKHLTPSLKPANQKNEIIPEPPHSKYVRRWDSKITLYYNYCRPLSPPSRPNRLRRGFAPQKYEDQHRTSWGHYSYTGRRDKQIRATAKKTKPSASGAARCFSTSA